MILRWTRIPTSHTPFAYQLRNPSLACFDVPQTQRITINVVIFDNLSPRNVLKPLQRVFRLQE